MDINEKVQPFKGSLVHEFTGFMASWVQKREFS